MKWLILVSDAPFMAEFFGKLAKEIKNQGDECLVVLNSKIAEYKKRELFFEDTKFISKVDWCVENYDKNKKDFENLSWRELFPIFDRYKSLDFNYQNSFSMLSETFQFFDYIFQTENPDVVISEPPADFFHLIARNFCKKHKIPYVGSGSSRFQNRIDIYDEESTFSQYEKTFKELKDGDLSRKEKEFAKIFAENFISHKRLPSYMHFIKTDLSQADIVRHFARKPKESFALLWRYFKNRKRFKEFDYESEAIFKNSFLSPFLMEKRKLRTSLQKKFFENYKTDKNFFLFPLHFQSEASTSVYATYYNDQLNTINNTAFAIPFPYKLYVKEHPAAVGTRPASYYKKLKEIPNVVLLSPYENVENIVKDSAGVITLTSTVGLEAALAGKPVYVLGNVFYSYHPLCKTPKNFEELKTELENDTAQKQGVNDLEEINIRFITSYFRNTIEGSIAASSFGQDTNDYTRICQSLKNIL
ncbi:MAG: hypothetical protein HYT36_00270 [Candidatus Staskawiczbacteria bacterium]|nr:hypothetical protein [Candidatus Staskawiczbacteria bacterium]